MRIPDQRHDDLGMSEPISRRDFLNGALLVGAGLLLPGKAPAISPADAFNGYGGVGDYRHSNGNTWEVLSTGHALRDGAFEQRVADAAVAVERVRGGDRGCFAVEQQAGAGEEGAVEEVAAGDRLVHPETIVALRGNAHRLKYAKSGDEKEVDRAGRP